MLPVVLKLKLAMTLATGMSGASGVPASSLTAVTAANAGAPIAVSLFDENYRTSSEVAIERDGSVDEETARQLAHVFRCRRTEREPAHGLAKQTYVMLADLAAKYRKPIEFVSAYRAGRDEGWESPHRKATALDFRIRGENLGEIRDYLWAKYRDVGIGWYPGEGFLHMDTRPEVHDTAWTFIKGTNYYHPYWAEAARMPKKPTLPSHKPGV